MSGYRYLLFPRGNQPTTGEVGELQNYAGSFLGRFAYGTDRKTNSLTIAFESEAFEQALQTHAGFRALIHKWELRGAKLEEHLGFVKNPEALRPVPSNPWSPQIAAQPSTHSSHDKLIAAKELAAREALGRAQLSVHQTVQRHQTLTFLAGWVPYLLIAGGTLLTILAGTYTYQRLSDTGIESRKKTIERIVDDTVQEPSGEQPISRDAESVP